MSTWDEFIQDANSSLIDLSMLFSTHPDNPMVTNTALQMLNLFYENQFVPNLFRTADQAAMSLRSLCGYLTTRRWLETPGYFSTHIAGVIEDFIDSEYPDPENGIQENNEESWQTIWERHVINYHFRLNLTIRQILMISAESLEKRFLSGVLTCTPIDADEAHFAKSIGHTQYVLLKNLIDDNIDNIIDYGVNAGTLELYLSRALQESAQDYLFSLDKLYDSHNKQLDIIRSFKCLHDIYKNNDVKYEDHGLRKALTHYFGKLGKISHPRIQVVMEHLLLKKSQASYNEKNNDIEKQKLDRITEEAEIKGDYNWRYLLDLPLAQLPAAPEPPSLNNLPNQNAMRENNADWEFEAVAIPAIILPSPARPLASVAQVVQFGIFHVAPPPLAPPHSPPLAIMAPPDNNEVNAEPRP